VHTTKKKRAIPGPSKPDNVVGANICNVTGLLPGGTEGSPTCSTRFEYFLDGTVPTKIDGVDRADLAIFNDTGQVANVDALPEQISMQNRPVYLDPLGTIYCLDCPVASASATIRYP